MHQDDEARLDNSERKVLGDRSITWDESTRPRTVAVQTDARRSTGQGEHLVLIHDMYREQLAAITRIRDQVKAGLADVGLLRGQINAMTLRSHFGQFGAYCAQYCHAVNIHHTIEDRHMFPALRAADSHLGDVLDRLAEEHDVIHAVLVELDEAAVDLATLGGGFDEVDRLIDVLASGLLSHLAYEEDQLVGPLSRHAIVI